MSHSNSKESPAFRRGESSIPTIGSVFLAGLLLFVRGLIADKLFVSESRGVHQKSVHDILVKPCGAPRQGR